MKTTTTKTMLSLLACFIILSSCPSNVYATKYNGILVINDKELSNEVRDSIIKNFLETIPDIGTQTVVIGGATGHIYYDFSIPQSEETSKINPSLRLSFARKSLRERTMQNSSALKTEQSLLTLTRALNQHQSASGADRAVIFFVGMTDYLSSNNNLEYINKESKFYFSPNIFHLCKSKFIVMESGGSTPEIEFNRTRYWNKYCSYLSASPAIFQQIGNFLQPQHLALNDNDSRSCTQTDTGETPHEQRNENIKIDLTWRNETARIGMTVVYNNEELGHKTSTSSYGRHYSFSKTNKTIFLDANVDKIKIIVEQIVGMPPISPTITISCLGSKKTLATKDISNPKCHFVAKNAPPQMFYSEDISLNDISARNEK